MKIRKKLLMVFIALASLAGFVGYLTISSLSEITTDMEQIRKSSILELESSTEMAYELLKMKGLVRQYVNETGKDRNIELTKVKQELSKCFTEYEKALGIRKQVTQSGLELYNANEMEGENEELNKTTHIDLLYQQYKKQVHGMMTYDEKLFKTGKYKSIGNDLDEKMDHMIEEVAMFKIDAQEEIIEETTEVVDEAYESTKMLTLITAFSLILAVVSGIFITRSIVIPILKLKSAAENVAHGDMDIQLSIKNRDEIGELATSFNKMTCDLKKNRTEMQEYNNTLEEKVTERTIELEESIKRLKETEETLKEYTNDLKNSNRELEQFAYVASHDLQEPLRTTTNFVDLLQKQYMGKLDARADKYMVYIIQATARMRSLIGHLLEYSRIGSKKELHQVDTHLTLQEVITDLGTAIADAGAVITSGPLPVIPGYPTEIKQLFQNLIINAIKFKKKNEHPQISICSDSGNGAWTFSVTDNGIGIEKQYYKKIFTIFQRLHNREEYEGSGIGLSNCKKIVELHKGKIWVESIPGTGSSFHFTIQKNIN